MTGPWLVPEWEAIGLASVGDGHGWSGLVRDVGNVGSVIFVSRMSMVRRKSFLFFFECPNVKSSSAREYFLAIGDCFSSLAFLQGPLCSSCRRGSSCRFLRCVFDINSIGTLMGVFWLMASPGSRGFGLVGKFLSSSSRDNLR